MLAEEAGDWNAVSEMAREGLHAVIYNHCRLKWPVEAAQVFDVYPFDQGTMLTVETMSKELALRIEQFNYTVGVMSFRCCEHNHLEKIGAQR